MSKLKLGQIVGIGRHRRHVSRSGEVTTKYFQTPMPARDQTLPLPPSPDRDLSYTSTWSEENARRIALASQAKQANDILLGLLHENIQRAQFNRYNLEVYVTIANLCRQNFEMIAGIHDMDVGSRVSISTQGQRS